jgi:hypothetical protein
MPADEAAFSVRCDPGEARATETPRSVAPPPDFGVVAVVVLATLVELTLR